jgi:hypothetical protein
MRESVRVVELARQAKVTKGRKLRLDATGVQTTIHHLTDSGLLLDSVRVLSRLVKCAKPLVQEQLQNVGAACRSRLRSARRAAQAGVAPAPAAQERDQRALYQKLIETSEQMVRQTERVVHALQQQSESAAKRLREQAERVVPLVKPDFGASQRAWTGGGSREPSSPTSSSAHNAATALTWLAISIPACPPPMAQWSGWMERPSPLPGSSIPLTALAPSSRPAWRAYSWAMRIPAPVKQFPIPEAGKRGVAVAPNQGLLYISECGMSNCGGKNGSLLAYDLVHDVVAWIANYSFGVDQLAVTPDGSTIYMPHGADASDGTHTILDASDGKVIGSIQTGTNGHNTIVSLDGTQVVYLTGYTGSNSNFAHVVNPAINQVTLNAGLTVNGVRPFTVGESLPDLLRTGGLGFE